MTPSRGRMRCSLRSRCCQGTEGHSDQDLRPGVHDRGEPAHVRGPTAGRTGVVRLQPCCVARAAAKVPFGAARGRDLQHPKAYGAGGNLPALRVLQHADPLVFCHRCCRTGENANVAPAESMLATPPQAFPPSFARKKNWDLRKSDLTKSKTTLEATQRQIDDFFSQLPYKCHQNRVASGGDSLGFAPGLPQR